jgi:hypothetical protein
MTSPGWTEDGNFLKQKALPVSSCTNLLICRLSAFEEPKDDPAGGELAVGSTGDLYYIAPGDIPISRLLFYLLGVLLAIV